MRLAYGIYAIHYKDKGYICLHDIHGAFSNNPNV